MSAVPAIAVSHLSKRFALYGRPAKTLAHRLLGAIGRSKRGEIWALRDVSLSVARGEMVGLVGANGSGKSTLLQVIAGIYAPDAGSVEVSGRLRALLELGVGFSPDLTGRENVFLYAALLGFPAAEVRRRFDAIVDFAELDRFIDMPLKPYSSGMQVRLAFATAAHLDPEILLLDEVLAVGDDRFQRKCLRRVREIRERDVAIVFVSHDLTTLERFCDRACLLQEGRLTAEGRPSDVIGRYRASLVQAGRANGAGKRWGSGEVTIESVALLGPGGVAQLFRTGDALTIRLSFSAVHPIARPIFGIGIRNGDGTLVTGPNTRMCGYPVDTIDGEGILEYRVARLPLLPGTYSVAVSVYDDAMITAYDHWEDCASFVVLDDGTGERFGAVSLGAEWRLARSPVPTQPA